MYQPVPGFESKSSVFLSECVTHRTQWQDCYTRWLIIQHGLARYEVSFREHKDEVVEMNSFKGQEQNHSKV